MKKKIALISPKGSFFFRDEKLNTEINSLNGFSFHARYWSGLGTALPILASLTPSCYDVTIFDENVESLDLETDWWCVGITAMTHQAIRAYQISSEYRKRGIHTVIGGSHASVCPDEAGLYCDTVVIGEGENIWPLFLEDLENGNAKPRYDARDVSPVDITLLPPPRYDLLKNKNYSTVWVSTSRGCPYDCEFCSVTGLFGRKLRHKKVSQVLEEIALIKTVFGRAIISFATDNMFVSRDYSRELVRSFIDIPFRWHAQTDITIGEDPEFLQLLYKAGCQTAFIGFESVNPENLALINDPSRQMKMKNSAQYLELVNSIQTNGISVWGAFIVGMDHDTREAFDDIADFVEKANIPGVQISVLTPLPGTRLRTRLAEEGRLLPVSWDGYTFTELTFIPRHMTFRDIEEGYIKALRRIYNEESRLRKAAWFKEVHKKLYRLNERKE